MPAYKQQCKKGALYDFGGNRIFAISDRGPWTSVTSNWDGQAPNSTESDPFPLAGHFGHVWDTFNLGELVGRGTDRPRELKARIERRGNVWWILQGTGQKVILSVHIRDRVELPEMTPEPEDAPDDIPEGGPDMEGNGDETEETITSGNLRAVITDIIQAMLPAIIAKAETNLLTHTLPAMLRPSDCITLPSGARRDMSFCIGMTDRGDALWVRWAFGYRIGYNKKTDEWTVAGTEWEVYTGEDAVQLKAWWDSNSTKLPLQLP